MKKKRISLDNSIKILWDRIEDWLQQHWKGKVQLPVGASEEEIENVEACLGVKLPKELTDSYRIHNGSGKITLIPFEPWGMTYPLLGLPSILRNWEIIQDGVRRGYFSGDDFINDPKGPIKKVWFHKSWIPFMDDQSGDFFSWIWLPPKVDVVDR